MTFARCTLAVTLLAAATSAQLVDERWGCEADWLRWGEVDLIHFAHDLAADGDWNGDGYDDLLIASVSNPTSESITRRVDLFLGAPAGDPGLAEPCFGILRLDTVDYSPAVAWLGDVDGGGLDDIAVGTCGESASPATLPRAGRVHVFFAENHQDCGELSLEDADVIIEGTTAHGWLGLSVGAAGDVLGDGTRGLIVGAPGTGDDDTTTTTPGRAFVFSGTTLRAMAAAGLQGQGLCQGCPGQVAFPSDAAADWIMEGDADDDRFGWSVAGAGDVDGDGDDDVLVGALQATYSGGVAWFVGNGPGYARLYRYPDTAGIDLPSAAPSGFEPRLFGHVVQGGSDLDGDGRPDILVGAPYYTPVGTGLNPGAVYAYSVSPTGVPEPLFGPGFQPVTWSLGDELVPGANFGWDVVMPGDFNPSDGLGRNDFVASAPGYSAPVIDPPAPCVPGDGQLQGGNLSGRVFVVSGGDASSASGGAWPPPVLARYKGEGTDRGRLGIAVGAGRVDGPGSPFDVLTGASALTPIDVAPGVSELGRAYLFLNPTDSQDAPRAPAPAPRRPDPAARR